MNRRNFLQILGASTLTVYAPGLWADDSSSSPSKPQKQTTKTTDNSSAKQPTKQLILIELKGGNDALNTLIPYADKNYYQQRPKIALPEKKIIPLSDQVGLHPALAKLKPLWDQQQLAWLQGVGYPNPNRSHFRSIEIWDTGELEEDSEAIGWVSQALGQTPFKGVAINSNLGPLYTDDLSTVGFTNAQQFARLGQKIKGSTQHSSNNSLEHVLNVQSSVDQLASKLFAELPHAPKPQSPFPKYALGKDLETVYTLIAAGFNAPVYKVSLGGFDTHVNQLPRHQSRLNQLSEALVCFAQNLQAIQQWENTLILSYSEFGRRLQENASQGTDHGAAAAHFALGGRVKGGLYGEYPSLKKLDERGDLKYTLDFRDLYQTIDQRWWQLATTHSTGQNLGFI